MAWEANHLASTFLFMTLLHTHTLQEGQSTEAITAWGCPWPPEGGPHEGEVARRCGGWGRGSLLPTRAPSCTVPLLADARESGGPAHIGTKWSLPPRQAGATRPHKGASRRTERAVWCREHLNTFPNILTSEAALLGAALCVLAGKGLGPLYKLDGIV